MDQLSIQRIQTLHPKIRKEVEALYTQANNKLGKSVKLRMAYTSRTDDEQNKLYAQGRSTPGKIVTNAKAGNSMHNYHLAFDIVLLYDNDGNGTFEEASWNTKRDGDKDEVADWLEVTAIFTKAGYQNGFLKNGKRWDLPHFQKTFGLSIKQLKAKIVSGDYFTEIINDVEYKYVNL